MRLLAMFLLPALHANHSFNRLYHFCFIIGSFPGPRILFLDLQAAQAHMLQLLLPINLLMFIIYSHDAKLKIKIS